MTPNLCFSYQILLQHTISSSSMWIASTRTPGTLSNIHISCPSCSVGQSAEDILMPCPSCSVQLAQNIGKRAFDLSYSQCSMQSAEHIDIPHPSCDVQIDTSCPSCAVQNLTPKFTETQ
jgi:hypothetical protein